MKKIKKISQIRKIAERLKFLDKKIVFTNGCFDILHRGHVEYLSKAKRLGDVLIVGLNTDSSIKRLKGKTRPLNKQLDRAIVLAALETVDYVTFFDDDTPLKLIKALKPDVLVKGGDWPLSEIIGADIVRKSGGRVLSLALVKGYSTSRLIKKINDV